MGCHIIKHDVHFNSISIKAFIHFRRLNEIADIAHSMWVLGHEWSSDASPLDADATE